MVNYGGQPVLYNKNFGWHKRGGGPSDALLPVRCCRLRLLIGHPMDLMIDASRKHR